MGRNSVAAQVVNAGANLAGAPERETARALGAQGVTDTIQSLNDAGAKANNETADFVSGQAKKNKEDAAQAEAQQTQRDNQTAADTQKQAAQAANDEAEANRMSQGSTSRTLLTGPNGLEDDDGVTMSRRTLSAR